MGRLDMQGAAYPLSHTRRHHATNFGDLSVELDAIEPNRLRNLVELVIQRHLPPDQFTTLKAAEDRERALIAGLVGMIQKVNR
jgi:hypothetical protein